MYMHYASRHYLYLSIWAPLRNRLSYAVQMGHAHWCRQVLDAQVKKQETQLSQTNRATHLCRRNCMADFIKKNPPAAPDNKLRYFGHVLRADNLWTSILHGRIAGTRKRGRPRRLWTDNIKELDRTINGWVRENCTGQNNCSMACKGVAGFGLRPSGMRKNQSSPVCPYWLECRISSFCVKGCMHRSIQENRKNLKSDGTPLCVDGRRSWPNNIHAQDMCYNVKSGSSATLYVRINRKEPENWESWDPVPLGWGCSWPRKNKPPPICVTTSNLCVTGRVCINRMEPPKLGSEGPAPLR